LTTNTTHTHDVSGDGPSALVERARAAARSQRAADPYAFEHRYDDLNSWTRRARIARDIAASLDIPLAAVTVTNDSKRTYGPGRGIPGDLITVTEGTTVWQFVPDFTAEPGDRWVLLGECPDCEEPGVPMIPVTTLADIGEWLDPDIDDRYDRVMAAGFFDSDPAHHPGCEYGNGTASR
jgi:hypothetical protein